MKKVDMTKGNAAKVILALALPIMGSSLLQFTYNLIDMLWVGGLGSNAVASVGTSSFFLNLGYAINSLVVMGTGIKTAHSLGAKNDKDVHEYINTGTLINLVLAVIYSVALIVFGKAFISFLNVDNASVQRESFYYMSVSAPMMFFSFFNLLYTRILNSYGINKAALKINAIGLVLNIILDPLFIYTFKLGVSGAALSSLISNLIIFIIFIVKYREVLTKNLRFKIDKKKAMEIVHLGIPMSCQRVLFTVVNILLGRMIGSFGSDAIAAQKIALQVESIKFMVVGGLNGAVSSFTGQNYGAKKPERIKEGYKSSLKIGLIYSFSAALVLLTMPDLLVRLFIGDAATVEIAVKYLRIIAVSEMFSAVEMVSNGLFTGIGKPKIPATISVVFTVIRIPLAAILINFYGLDGIWLGISISSILKGMTSYLIYQFSIKKHLIGSC